MKMFVFSMREFDELQFFERYTLENNIEWAYTTQTPCLDNLALAAGYDAINIITTPFNRAMIDKLKALGIKCIATRTIGYDHIDYEYARSIGIGVINITYSPATVADYAIMLMLIGCRKLPFTMQQANVQNYSLAGKIGRELRNCTVGIIGTGRIGKTVIDELHGFGCRILAYDIHEDSDISTLATYTSLEEIYSQCDIISLHMPLNDSTYHIISSEAFAQMRENVIIINCARGQLIDTEALIDALNSGKVGFAGLDVIEDEKQLYYFNRTGEALNNPQLAILKSFSNVLVTPHTAFYTQEAVSDMVENSIIGINNYFKHN